MSDYPQLIAIDEVTEDNYEFLSANYHCKIGEWAIHFEMDDRGSMPEGGLVFVEKEPTDEEILKIARSL